MKSIKLYVTLLLSFCLTTMKAQELAITNVNVVDVVNGEIIPNSTIFMIEGTIVQINNSHAVKLRKKTEVLDGSGKYVIPGLMDAHIHFFQTGGLYTRPDALDLRNRRDYNEERAKAFELTENHFKRYLRQGVTTVVDVGGPFTNFKIRDSIAKTKEAPNVLVTGPLFSTYQPKNLGTIDPPIILTLNKEKVDSLFDKMLPYKPDFIKIWYVVTPELPAEKTYPIIEYIGKKTHELGLKLAIHATQLKTAQLAVKAGADILVHSIDDEIIPSDFVNLLIEKQISYIPTLMVHDGYVSTFTKSYPNHYMDIRWADPFAYGSLKDLKVLGENEIPEKLKKIQADPTAIKNKYSKADATMLVNLKMLNDAGVLISTGTDAGNIGTMHASSYYQELEWMERSGMSAKEIIKASTFGVAKTFGKEKEMGQVAVSLKADLLVLNENPLESIAALKSIHSIIKSGRILDINKLEKETVEELVQRQLNAYNARNIDAFMETYADSIELYSFDGTLISKGQEPMRKRYAKMFESTPNLHCEIKNRMVLGNKIIDKEYVRFNDKFVNAIAVYEVKDGLIYKVTFIK